MIDSKVRELINSPRYTSLISRRRRVIGMLSGINVAAYVVYVLCMGYARDLMAIRVAGSAMNIGLLFTIFIIVFAVVLSGYYMWWTNKHGDPELKKVLTDFGLNDDQNGDQE